MSVQYAWNPAARLKGDAQKVGEKIEALRKQHGTVSPKQVVQAAKPQSSVLHAYFTWDDHAAADGFREYQASRILRAITVIHEPSQMSTRAFVSIKAAADAGGGSYTNVRIALRKYKKELLNDALRDLDAYRRKYSTLTTLALWDRNLSAARDELLAAIAA